MALANLDAVLLESRGTFETLPEHVLAQLEEVQRLQSPRASASTPADSALPWPSPLMSNGNPGTSCASLHA